MKLLFDERLSPKLVELLRAPFPDSESALETALPEWAIPAFSNTRPKETFLVSTNGDVEGLLSRVPDAHVVILRSRNYPTEIAAEVLRRNAIRVAELPTSKKRLVALYR